MIFIEWETLAPVAAGHQLSIPCDYWKLKKEYAWVASIADSASMNNEISTSIRWREKSYQIWCEAFYKPVTNYEIILFNITHPAPIKINKLHLCIRKGEQEIQINLAGYFSDDWLKFLLLFACYFNRREKKFLSKDNKDRRHWQAFCFLGQNIVRNISICTKKKSGNQNEKMHMKMRHAFEGAKKKFLDVQVCDELCVLVCVGVCESYDSTHKKRT